MFGVTEIVGDHVYSVIIFNLINPVFPSTTTTTEESQQLSFTGVGGANSYTDAS